MLLILDGWGIGQVPAADAILQAHTPTYDRLWQEFPHTTLTTYGEAVGLPQGQIGNSEVGHLNIGAGRVVFQELVRVSKEIKETSILHNAEFTAMIKYANMHHKPIHLMGLLSDGGVHSHIDHLMGLCDLLSNSIKTPIYLHCFLDGRDTDPQNGAHYLQKIINHIADKNIHISTIIGRYYAMDRDKRWDRISKAYKLLTGSTDTDNGEIKLIPKSEIITTITNLYQDGITDEFMTPIAVSNDTNHDDNHLHYSPIKPEDAVVSYNFRTDRCREITEVLTQRDMPELGMKKIPLYYVTMTRYDEGYKDVHVLFEKDNLVNTIGEVVADAGRSQLRIAETEKYPHVTYFFNGGREEKFQGEHRIMVASPKVATYDLQPEMSAFEIKEQLINYIQSNKPDFIVTNFANTDMVGHTGVFSAAVKAAETVDQCLSEIIPIALSLDYVIVIIADHGNADLMINPDGSPHTAHTTNPVPCIMVSNKPLPSIKAGKLADLAPTILSLMGIEIPKEMNGELLLK